MTWQKDDEVFFEKLRDFPNLRMRAESKQHVWRELNKMEQAISSGRVRRVLNRRVWGAVLAGVTGLALFAVGVGYSESKVNSSYGGTSLAGDGSKGPFSYFGYHVPFEPQIPTKMASGFKLSSTGIDMTYSNGRARFSRFWAVYNGPQVKPFANKLGTAHRQIDVSEVYGNSVEKFHPILNLHVKWKKIAEVNHETYYTYYVSNPSIGAPAVGFVKNHVIYFISASMGENVAESQLVKYAQSITKRASVQTMNISGQGYQNSLRMLKFHPFIPKALESTYKLSFALGEIVENDKGTTQSITLNFEMKNDHRKGFGVTEAPLKNAENGIVFPPNPQGYIPRWKDFKRGLEFSMGGNTNSSEFHRVLNLFRGSN